MPTIGEWAKVYGTGNYADQSRRTSAAVEKAINENRVRVDRFRAQEDRARKMEMEDYAMSQLKRQEMQGLIIPNDSPYDSVDNHYQQAARLIPDQYSQLTKAAKDGYITPEEAAMGQAKLMSEVGNLKSQRNQVIATRNAWGKMVAERRVSGRNKEQNMAYYNTLLTPDNSLRIVGEKGEQGFKLAGKTIDGGNISIPNAKAGMAPFPILKAEDPRIQLQKTNAIAYDRGQYTSEKNPDLVAAWKDSFDNTMLQLGDEGGKGVAVDWMGMTNEQVDRLSEVTNYSAQGGSKQFVPAEILNKYMDPKTGQAKEGMSSIPSEFLYSSELEYEMEKQWIKMGEATFLESKLDREKYELAQANADYKKEQLRQLKNTGKQPKTTYNTDDDLALYDVLVPLSEDGKTRSSIFDNVTPGPSLTTKVDRDIDDTTPGGARNITKNLQSYLSSAGFKVAKVYQDTKNDKGETIKEPKEGYAIPHLVGKGESFIAFDEDDPGVIFKAIKRAEGATSKQANFAWQELTKKYPAAGIIPMTVQDYTEYQIN